MTFFFRHKFFTIFLIFLVWYWIYNPSGRIGYARKGIAVYNRFPVFLFDLYVTPDGKMILLEDLNNDQSVPYWYNTHFTAKSSENARTSLIIGTGFDSTCFTLDYNFTQKVQNHGIFVKQMPSPDAVNLYNSMRDSLKPVSILLKIK